MFALLPKVDAGLEDLVDFIGAENMFAQPRNAHQRRQWCVDRNKCGRDFDKHA